MIATVPPAASAASWATRPRPSPPSTASTISRWTARSRSTSEAWRTGSMGRGEAGDEPPGEADAAIRPLRDRLGFGGRAGVRLQRLLAGLAGADAVRLV